LNMAEVSLEKLVVNPFGLMPLKKVVVELDLTNLDEEIELDQIREIHIVYYNIGEGEVWEELVPWKVIKDLSVFCDECGERMELIEIHPSRYRCPKCKKSVEIS